jgi:hypothetical protein
MPADAPQQSFSIAMWSRRAHLPGQVPGNRVLQDQREVERLVDQQPRADVANAMLEYTDPVLTPGKIVDNLGMPFQQQLQWARFLRDAATNAPNEVTFRQSLFERFRNESLDPGLRSAIFQRSVNYARQVRKSMLIVYTPDELKKARQVTPVGGITPGGYRKVTEDQYVKEEPGAGKQMGLFGAKPEASKPKKSEVVSTENQYRVAGPTAEKLSSEVNAKGIGASAFEHTSAALAHEKAAKLATKEKDVSYHTGIGKAHQAEADRLTNLGKKPVESKPIDEGGNFLVPDKPIDTKRMHFLGTYQDGEVEAHWDPEHKNLFYLDVDTKMPITGPTLNVSSLAEAQKQVSKELDPQKSEKPKSGKAWFEGEHKEAVFAAMRRIETEIAMYGKQERSLIAPYGSVAVGSAAFDPMLEGQVRMAFLRELRSGQDPETAGKVAKEFATEMIKKHNSQHRDKTSHRWTGAGDGIVDRLVSEINSTYSRCYASWVCRDGRTC